MTTCYTKELLGPCRLELCKQEVGKQEVNMQEVNMLEIKLFLKEHSSLNLVLIFNEIMVIKLYIYFLGNDQLVLHLKIVCLPAMMCVNFATAKYLQKRLRHIIV